MTDVDRRREQLAKLREPFRLDEIGKLPKITCSPCSKAESRVCAEHRKSKCGTCGNWITSAHLHLDYVGHADITHVRAQDSLFSFTGDAA